MLHLECLASCMTSNSHLHFDLLTITIDTAPIPLGLNILSQNNLYPSSISQRRTTSPCLHYLQSVPSASHQLFTNIHSPPSTMPPKKKVEADTEAAANNEAGETVHITASSMFSTITDTLQKFAWTTENDRAVSYQSTLSSVVVLMLSSSSSSASAATPPLKTTPSSSTPCLVRLPLPIYSVYPHSLDCLHSTPVIAYLLDPSSCLYRLS